MTQEEALKKLAELLAWTEEPPPKDLPPESQKIWRWAQESAWGVLQNEKT